ncbi:radical SAM protein [Desulfonatronovibrio magnus]|uniref:radical SAM protein n=1 Tax=Desulfonatronovibrio magnus TaxID=698827 RepID=UPI0005EB3D36|nr:radical SAM protein [Desulfonatronovibrio magnus]
MSKKSIPRMISADENGEIFEDPELLMLLRQGEGFVPPRPDELIPLPADSDLFLLPGRKAIGLDPQRGTVMATDSLAVAGFASPGHTLAGTAAYITDSEAPDLPLYAYGAIGYMHDQFWIAARKVDKDMRQVFSPELLQSIPGKVRNLIKKYPRNRLIQHLTHCALNSCCPAARNLALGRFEAPLPTSRNCNARCVGCISFQPAGSSFQSTQDRISFTPTVEEVAEVMLAHGSRVKKPILSFGQGCEGEPLTMADLICNAVAKVRKKIPKATININTNGSMPDHVEDLALAGVDSFRVSLNSADPDLYSRYYKPVNYNFSQVQDFILKAKKHDCFVSLNLLYFPGITDTESEIDSMTRLISDTKLDYIQMRNLNLDPEIYLHLMQNKDFGPQTGLLNYMKRLKKECPWIEYGYFNPYLGR